MVCKYRFIKYFFLIWVTLSYSGCASTSTTDLVQQLEKGSPYSNSFRDFPFEKAIIGSKTDFQIDNKSPIANLPMGKTYFKAFELPKADKPYYIVLKSYLISKLTDPLLFPVFFDVKFAGDPGEPYVFAPYVTILDGNFKIVRTISLKNFQLAANFRWTCFIFCGPSSGIENRGVSH